MQLTIPDCCQGEFCPGVHVEGHNQKEDGTLYSNDDHENNAYHYHNTDGSVFYRYSDGSEYCRRKNGNITFRLSANSPNKVEGEDPTVAPASTATGRIRQPWIDWPPRLKLSIKTEGSSVVIRDDSGLTVTFEPVGSQVEVDPVPAYDRSPFLGRADSDRVGSQASQCSIHELQDWVRRQPLPDIMG